MFDNLFKLYNKERNSNSFTSIKLTMVKSSAANASAAAINRPPYEGVLHLHAPTRFKAVIPTTPRWKMQAIATYKRQQRIKKDRNANFAPKLDSKSPSLIVSAIKDTVALPETLIPKVKIPTENIQRELDGLSKSSDVIKREMNALSSIKVHLMWLLRKTSIHETQRNHNLT